MYKVTERGLDIARESGLEDFAVKFVADVHEKKYQHPAILDAITDPGFTIGKDGVIKESIDYAFSKLNDPEEKYRCADALNIDKSRKWRSLGGLATGTLFPIREITDFHKTSPDIDKYVLSGVVGLNFVNHRNQVHLLARSRYKDYGFDSYVDATSFVGAYLVSAHTDALNKRFQIESDNGFVFTEGNVKSEISVGASFHGDFRITQTSALTSDIISPLNNKVEFSPNKGITVAGYHSCEVMLLTDLLTSTFLDGGIEELKKCIEEFEYIYNYLGVDYRRGNFADYGDSMSDHFALSSLSNLIEDDDYQKNAERPLTALPYLPQSPTLMASYSDDKGGLILCKIEESNYDIDKKTLDSPDRAIHIKKEHRQGFFAALIGQTKAGLGRTSPLQLVNIIEMSKGLTEGKSLEDLMMASIRSRR